jgi:hypothetical protein
MREFQKIVENESVAIIGFSRWKNLASRHHSLSCNGALRKPGNEPNSNQSPESLVNSRS